MLNMRRNLVRWTSGCALVLSALGYWCVGIGAPGKPTRLLSVDKDSSSFGVKRGPSLKEEDLGGMIWVHNEYTRDRPLQLYPWKHLAEPFKPTTLQVVSSEQYGPDVHFRWEYDSDLLGYGNTIQTTFETVGDHKITVSGFTISMDDAGRGPGGAITYEDLLFDDFVSYEFGITVKYVRREIRSLTDRDREEFFNAVAVLQRVPSAVGRKIYGRKYYSKDYFTRLHLYYGGDKFCDHWHEGAGFVTSHVAITLMYEQALQSVKPAVSVPYWDFTLESTFFGPSDFRTSGVFADDWFGPANPQNSMHTPDRGRFAYVPFMMDARDYSKVTNAYGLMRSPWNTDRNPFMTRHDHVFGFLNNRKPSGCKNFRSTVRNDIWMELALALNTKAHGHIHELMGGTWSSDFVEIANRVTPKAVQLSHSMLALTKYLWRSDHASCPDACSLDQPWTECQCTCKDPESVGKTPSEILEDAQIFDYAFFYDREGNLIQSFEDDEGHTYYTIPGYTKEESEDIFSELLDVLCTPTMMGTNYEGASTNDVIFWVLHPTVDRAWHLRRLTDKPFDDEWKDDHDCYGHNPDNVTPFHNLFRGGDATSPGRDESQVSEGVGLGERHRHSDEAEDKFHSKNTDRGGIKRYYTNRELYQLFSPAEEDLPYIYDNFEWPHCDLRGVEISPW